MINKLRFCVQFVVPTTFDDSMSIYVLMNKLVDKVNDVIGNVNGNTTNIEALDKRLDEVEAKIPTVFVESVNGKTGIVTLTHEDVAALSDNYIIVGNGPGELEGMTDEERGKLAENGTVLYIEPNDSDDYPYEKMFMIFASGQYRQVAEDPALVETVKNLSGTVNGINNRLVTVEGDLTTVKANLATLTSDVNALKTRVDTVETALPTKASVNLIRFFNKTEWEGMSNAQRMALYEQGTRFVGAQDVSIPGKPFYRLYELQQSGAAIGCGVNTVNGQPGEITITPQTIHAATDVVVRFLEQGDLARSTTTIRQGWFQAGTLLMTEPIEEGKLALFQLSSDGSYEQIGTAGGGGGDAVTSVNGKTGDVILNAQDVGAAPTVDLEALSSQLDDAVAQIGDKYSPTNPPPYPVTSVNGKTGAITNIAKGAIENTSAVFRIPSNNNFSFAIANNGAVSSHGNIGGFNTVYSSVSPPPYPVTSVNGKKGAVVIDVGGGAVDSVNGKTGAVVLNAVDVGALPDTYEPPAPPVTSVNTKTGAVVLNAEDVGAATPAQVEAVSAEVAGKYGPGNEPPYPVTSVNTKTGAVTLGAADVGAATTAQVAAKYGPDNVPPYPVTSVNGQTGDVGNLATSENTSWGTTEFKGAVKVGGRGIAVTKDGVIYGIPDAAEGIAQYSAANPPPIIDSSSDTAYFIKSNKTGKPNLYFGESVAQFSGEDITYTFSVPNTTTVFWVLSATFVGSNIPVGKCTTNGNVVRIKPANSDAPGVGSPQNIIYLVFGV